MSSGESSSSKRGRLDRALDGFERVGNRLPDPTLLFVVLLVGVWLLSAVLAPIEFDAIDPRTAAPIRVVTQLSGVALSSFLSGMVQAFTAFPPLGVVLVALMGVGVAEHSGFIDACLRRILAWTPRNLLTPMLILVGLLSHTASDSGFVLVIPMGGVLFAAAGRHPLAGIAAAFAGVSGGFSANLIPSGLDPILAGLTQSGAALIAPGISINPLCNLWFGAASAGLILLLGWFLTDRVIEPRLAHLAVDGDGGRAAGTEAPTVAATPSERRALRLALGVLVAMCLGLLAVTMPAGSPLRGNAGGLTESGAPLMRSIVPLIFLLFLVPGATYGFASGRFRSHRDVIQGMTKATGAMAYYLVMTLCAALFVDAFSRSNLGALLALEGAAALRALDLPQELAIVGLILVTATVNLFIGSASAEWALLAPILVPLMMQLGIAPELTQAAYRVGDSCTNIASPLMVYFPLVVVYCQRYVRGAGVGTLFSMMIPYSIAFLVAWTLFLLVYWRLGLSLGLEAATAWHR
jgi:aminobenzoyl-glutamate transport protein